MVLYNALVHGNLSARSKKGSVVQGELGKLYKGCYCM